MKSLYNVNLKGALLLFSIFFLLNACKKDHPKPANPGDNGNGNTGRLSDQDSLKFYIWYINVSDSANVPFYLWEDQVPADFKWYSKEYNGKTEAETADNIMRMSNNSIASYSPKINGHPKDKYSFIDMKGTVSKELQGGLKGDFGYMVAGAQDPDKKVHLIIEYAYKGSPAAKAGIERGDEIVGIDGTTDFSLKTQSGVDFINQHLFQDSVVSLQLKKHDGTTISADLRRAEYHLDPILFDSVYTVSGKKVGYLVYNSFVSVISDKNGATAKDEIDKVFSKFKSKGVNELIVDLRYNGGGAVATSEYFDNLMAPASTAGQKMYQYIYNKPLTKAFNSNANLINQYIAPVKFQTVPDNLNLSRVFFIVGGGTASASELTMNNLKPYMDVQLVGKKTYGKPVGFFTISINFVTEKHGKQHVADMYAIDFKSVNSAGKSDYFDGMTPDVDLFDYIGYNWGDPQDPRLETIFNYIKSGTYLTQADFSRMARRQNAEARKANGIAPLQLRRAPAIDIKDNAQFNGMVDYRRSSELSNLKK